MPSSLKDKVAVVTGGGRGIRVGLNDLNASGAQVIPVPGNVAMSSAANAMFDCVEKAFGRVDILVNNASVLRPTRAESIIDEEWDFVVNGNLRNTFLCCWAAISALRKAGGGSIGQMSSSAGKSVQAR